MSKKRMHQIVITNTNNGKMNIGTPLGNIDIVTQDSIILVGRFKNWDRLAMKIIDISRHCDKKRKIYLYDIPKSATGAYVEAECSKFKIQVYHISDK